MPHDPIYRVRRAVRAVLDAEPARPSTLLVACSGGADSLALLVGAVAERDGGRALRVVGVTVDHDLQEGSAAQAQRVVGQMAALGADETVATRVRVEGAGQGVEAAAREARYAVLEQVAEHVGAGLVLLGHTLDDQAETVLLGLARGSGGRSLGGMRRGFGRFRRPLLQLRRADTEAACAQAGVEPWQDPHNADPRFLRPRVRHTVLPVLERELGPGVAETLARTGWQLQDDAEALEGLAAQAAQQVRHPGGGLDVVALAALHRAVRTRVLHAAALAAGCPPSELGAVHVAALEAQVHNTTHLPREVQLPGHVRAVRAGDHLRFRRAPVEG